MNHQQKFNLDYIIFWSGLLVILFLSHKANGILTESNDLRCTDIQCPTKCPEDSYLMSTLDIEDDVFLDYEDEFISHFEELPTLVESHDEHPQQAVKERQKREVFFQQDIENCCGKQKCVCNKCPDVPKCFEGYIAVEMHEGQGVPGNCCSQYRCLKKEECQNLVKQTWWTSKCRKCSCFGESEFCIQICPEVEIVENCYSEYLQRPFINGATWNEGPCTNCNCEQGERRCFASTCPKLNCKHKITYEDVCCRRCVDDETDERIEIVNNTVLAEGDDGEANTETIELSINDEFNSTEVLENNSSTDIITLSDNFTSTSPVVASVETTTSASSEEITFTSPNSLESKIDEQFMGNTSSTEASTITLTSTLESSSVEDDVSSIKYESISSTISSSTSSDELHSEIDSTTKSLFGFDIDAPTSTTSTATTEEPKTFPENSSEEATTAISSTTDVTASTTISAMPSSAVTNDETTTQISIETSSAFKEDLSTPSLMTFDVPTTTISNVTTLENVSTGSRSTTTAASESTTTSSAETETESETETSTSTTTDNISISQMSSTLSSQTTTETPMDPPTTDISSVTTSTSTTSSPYSTALETSSSVNPVKQQLHEYETSTTSTTSAPEALMPLYQLYGDFNSDERISSRTSTQNQMRIMFDEIDYVVMIALFVGALMCIALGLIIRHAKNRKKMYSSIPNSETSLSQTSTVMTV